ncbi:unnamed protein product [Ambrosiozyma monospora]|uniref:Ataxin-10 homolog n=1 Tax=Ambrosiozyma monospora TaxID=43982 RepID=A0A9W6Z5T9_AMBMO|nr:unnamed protein product [Ambrosiozyma monospora]
MDTSDDNIQQLAHIHELVIATLDCFSNVVQFEHAREMLNFYKFLPKLLEFFKVVEMNTEKKKLKNQKQSVASLGGVSDPTKKLFPEVKSILIEIITCLVYQNKDNQDLVRNTQSLELILNNCNLDANEPFIKERAILCIKYLLENNPDNQNFISQLEAKGTDIDEENHKILTKAGFEVDIVDGKVKLKKAQKIEELEQKIRK